MSVVSVVQRPWDLAMPWKSKDYFLYGFSVKTIVLVRVYNQQFQGTILLMAFDFQGMAVLEPKLPLFSYGRDKLINLF